MKPLNKSRILIKFRFKTLTRNIRCRRGEKVAINLPVFQDENTRDPHEILVEKYGAEAVKASKPGHIYMDAMGFGMGQSCLQVSKLYYVEKSFQMSYYI